MNSTPVPRSVCSSLMSFKVCACVVTSSAVVGSSAMSSDGPEDQRHRDHDALALPARQLVRERVVHARRVGQVHLLDHGDDARAAFGRRQLRVFGQHLVELRAAAHDRVQRGHRLLEDHAHARAAQFAQPRFGHVHQVFALQRDAAAGAHRQALRQQAHGREGDDRFARARFADQADDFAGRHRQRHVGDGVVAVAALGQADAQVLEFEDGRFASVAMVRLAWPCAGRACRASRRRAC